MLPSALWLKERFNGLQTGGVGHGRWPPPVLPGYGAYPAYSVMQRELGATQVSVVLYLAPIYAAVMAWLVLGEPLQAHHAWGMALVLPAIYLVTRPPR